MASETIPQCADTLMGQGVNDNDKEELEAHDLCSVAVEIDNALSDEPAELFPSNVSKGHAVSEATCEEEGGNHQVLNTHEEANESSMVEEEAVSDQSQLSEGIIINSEGVNRVASFDTEFPPNEDEIPAAVVKTEPMDPDDLVLTENEIVPDLPLTQCALQLQFSKYVGNPGIAFVKQEDESSGKTSPAAETSNHFGAASTLIKKRKNRKRYKMLGKPAIKVKMNLEISPLGKKIFQTGQNLEAKDIPPVNTMDLCLVCSAPCVITRNRKIPSLPFCRKCKKAYFYQLGHAKKRPLICNNGSNCIIHYKSGIHCSLCHLEKFQRILHSAQAAFRSGSEIGPRAYKKKHSESRINQRETSLFVNDKQLIEEALNSYPLVVLNKMAMSPDETIDTKDLSDVFTSSEKRSNLETVSSPRMFAMPFEEDVVKQEICFANERGSSGNPDTHIAGSETEEDKSPEKLGPIKMPFGPLHGKAAKSSSNSSLSSSSEPTTKRRRGRPRKYSPPCQMQERPRKDSLTFKSQNLNSVTQETPRKDSFKSQNLNSVTQETPRKDSFKSQNLNSVTQEKPRKDSPKSQNLNRVSQEKPRKDSPKSQNLNSVTQEKPRKDSPKSQNLNSIPREVQEATPLKKLEPGEKDIQIFVFQCSHACSACNPSPSKDWLNQNGYLTVKPASQQVHNMQTDSNLYQKFLEFYNAAVNSAPKTSTSKAPHTNGSKHSPKIFNPDTVPIPTNMVPNSSSSSQPQMIVISPPPRQIANLSSPISSPVRSGTSAQPFKRKAVDVKPTTILSGPNLLSNQSQGSQQGIAITTSTIPNSASSNLANMSAVRMALNSQLLNQDGRQGYFQPNGLFFSPQNFPLSFPLQAISPSSSVRQPGAPYLLSPSSDLNSNRGPSSSKTRKL
ncbi:hypothetical protein EGW08_022783 [Elysia chlorotica]|uniref:Uncharacterized protein n=1 Tax=Elysia chlorotica TaxID=188477 RepID=A0A3S0ZKD8_ELYCH|nr:hypothetical protein EGW08_022783 [Elysia chlorotica]